MRKFKRLIRSMRAQAGHSLIEMMISVAVMTAVVGATATAMHQASRASEIAILTAGLNNSLRTGMDLIIRDLLQVGSGLPPAHVILIPSGTGAVQLNIPGPPGTALQTAVGDVDWAAVVPGPGLGPVINGVATDIITILTADNSFSDMPLSALTDTTLTVRATHPATGAAINIATGVNRILEGQLLMLEKGSFNTLVQVTGVNTSTRVITFANGDSLKLNQTAAAAGNVPALRAEDPPDVASGGTIPTTATRVRMISYYLDTLVPDHPRLVRRMNNGHKTTFDNTLGTAVAIDVENLQFTYDVADGNTNPTNVKFVAADYLTTGACTPDPCYQNQIRKVNVVLTGRSGNLKARQGRVFRNTLNSQVSLRGMAFVDQYLAPVAP
jgi:hypothetical protein